MEGGGYDHTVRCVGRPRGWKWEEVDMITSPGMWTEVGGDGYDHTIRHMGGPGGRVNDNISLNTHIKLGKNNL